MAATRSAVKVREALVYAPNSRESFFRDIVLSQLRRDPDARARLARHGQQMVVERERTTLRPEVGPAAGTRGDHLRSPRTGRSDV